MSQIRQPPLPPLPQAAVSRQELRYIASRQKGILVCILVYLMALGFRFALQPPLQLIPAGIALTTGIVASIFVFMLAIKLYGTGSGVVLGILTLIPLIGLFVLLSVNGKATAVLKKYGIQVGLLGANLDKI